MKILKSVTHSTETADLTLLAPSKIPYADSVAPDQPAHPPESHTVLLSVDQGCNDL